LLSNERRGYAVATWVVLAIAASSTLLLVLWACARFLAHRQGALLDDENHSTRLVTYALIPGESLRLPVTPGTEVIRVVAYAFRHGPLGAGEHRVAWQFGAGSTLEVSAPGATEHARAEERGLTVGDPVAFNIDAREQEPEISLRLVSVADAEGMLIRIYRREAAPGTEELLRRDSVSSAKRQRLAARAGELGWLDLQAVDRATLVAARWRKLAPLPSEGQPFRTQVVSLAPTLAENNLQLAEVLAEFIEQDGSRSGTLVGPNRLVVRADDPAAKLSLRSTGSLPAEQNASGVGRLDFAIASDRAIEFQLTSDRPTRISISAAEVQRIRLATSVEYDRISPGHPAIVQALEAPIVLSVDARPHLTAEDPASTPLRLWVDIAQNARTKSLAIDASVQRAAADRYESPEEVRSPAEPTHFYLLIPARGRATLGVVSGAADLALAELDPRDPERRFVRRRPTNWFEFTPLSHTTIRVAQRWPAERASPATRQAILRLKRPKPAALVQHAGLSFVPAETRLPFDVLAGGPSQLSLRLLSERPTDVTVLIDGGVPRRRASGLARTITTPRVVHVDSETRFSLFLGDDLEPGRHVLSFETRGTACSVHAPWQKLSKSPLETAWLVGDFQP
jgi:hypothetical protein